MSELRRKPDVDYYKVLQVDTEAEPEVVEAAYRALSKKYHPDLNSSPEALDRMSQINSAYDVLGDSLKRRDYNLLRDSAKHYIKPAPTSTSNTSATSNFRTTSTSSNASNFTRTSSAAGSTYNYQPGSTSTPNNPPKTSANSNSSTNRPASNANNPSGQSKTTNTNRPRNPYQTTRPNSRTEAQNRAKSGGRAGHYIYDSKNKIPLGRVVVILCLIVVALVVITLLLETFLGNPLNTHFITSPRQLPSAAVLPVEEQNQYVPPTATIVPTSTPIGDTTLTHDNALGFLQNANLFAGRVSTGDVNLTGADTLQLKIKMSDKGPGANADIAANTYAAPLTAAANDPVSGLRSTETTAYAIIYPLFRQYPALKHIILGLTNSNGDNLVYRADVTRDEAFGFYSWQQITSNMAVSDLVKLAISDRLASHFGAPQDDKIHNALLSPDESTLGAEIASWNIEGTTITTEGSGLITVSYLLNHSPAETQLDFIKILYALYTRFPNLDQMQVTTAIAGQNSGTTVFCSRDFFNKFGVSIWAQKIYTGDAQALYSALPKTQLALRQQNNVAILTPQVAHTTLAVRTWQAVVVKAEQINGVPGYTPNGNRQLWAVTVDLRNSSNTRIYPMPDEIFSLADNQRELYQPDIVAGVQYNLSNNFPNLTPLDGSQDGRITLIFSVPRTNTNLQLRLQLRDGDIKGQVLLQ